jgi:hypothetical protein
MTDVAIQQSKKQGPKQKCRSFHLFIQRYNAHDYNVFDIVIKGVWRQRWGVVV